MRESNIFVKISLFITLTYILNSFQAFDDNYIAQDTNQSAVLLTSIAIENLSGNIKKSRLELDDFVLKDNKLADAFLMPLFELKSENDHEIAPNFENIHDFNNVILHKNAIIGKYHRIVGQIKFEKTNKPVSICFVLCRALFIFKNPATGKLNLYGLLSLEDPIELNENSDKLKIGEYEEKNFVFHATLIKNETPVIIRTINGQKTWFYTLELQSDLKSKSFHIQVSEGGNVTLVDENTDPKYIIIKPYKEPSVGLVSPPNTDKQTIDTISYKKQQMNFELIKQPLNIKPDVLKTKVSDKSPQIYIEEREAPLEARIIPQVENVNPHLVLEQKNTANDSLDMFLADELEILRELLELQTRQTEQYRLAIKQYKKKQKQLIIDLEDHREKSQAQETELLKTKKQLGETESKFENIISELKKVEERNRDLGKKLEKHQGDADEREKELVEIRKVLSLTEKELINIKKWLKKRRIEDIEHKRSFLRNIPDSIETEEKHIEKQFENFKDIGDLVKIIQSFVNHHKTITEQLLGLTKREDDFEGIIDTSISKIKDQEEKIKGIDERVTETINVLEEVELDKMQLLKSVDQRKRLIDKKNQLIHTPADQLTNTNRKTSEVLEKQYKHSREEQIIAEDAKRLKGFLDTEHNLKIEEYDKLLLELSELQKNLIISKKMEEQLRKAKEKDDQLIKNMKNLLIKADVYFRKNEQGSKRIQASECMKVQTTQKKTKNDQNRKRSGLKNKSKKKQDTKDNKNVWLFAVVSLLSVVSVLTVAYVFVS
ncbi:hypothetical protein CDIK_2147 [Cucumispora dikerogammari]|nr:hypothetical protein CDIK_2147 [Cucumispora dikerogammari]